MYRLFVNGVTTSGPEVACLRVPHSVHAAQDFRFECIRRRCIHSIAFFCETIVNFAGKTDSSVFGAEYTLVIRVYSARFECIRRRTECIRRAFECIRRSIFLNSRPIRVYSAGFECIRRASVFGEMGECIRRELSHLLHRGCNNAVQGPSVFGEVGEGIQHIPQYPQYPQCLQCPLYS